MTSTLSSIVASAINSFRCAANIAVYALALPSCSLSHLRPTSTDSATADAEDVWVAINRDGGVDGSSAPPEDSSSPPHLSADPREALFDVVQEFDAVPMFGAARVAPNGERVVVGDLNNGTVEVFEHRAHAWESVFYQDGRQSYGTAVASITDISFAFLSHDNEGCWVNIWEADSNTTSRFPRSCGFSPDFGSWSASGDGSIFAASNSYYGNLNFLERSGDFTLSLAMGTTGRQLCAVARSGNLATCLGPVNDGVLSSSLYARFRAVIKRDGRWGEPIPMGLPNDRFVRTTSRLVASSNGEVVSFVGPSSDRDIAEGCLSEDCGGAALVYRRSENGTEFSFDRLSRPADFLFGHELAIAGDGESIAVSDKLSCRAAVYRFDRCRGLWSEAELVRVANASTCGAISSVDLSDDGRVLVAATRGYTPGVYVWRRPD